MLVSNLSSGLNFGGMFNDFRNNVLAKRLLSLVSNKMSICIRKISRNRAEEKAFTRFLRNKKCPSSVVLDEAFKKTQAASQECNHVLVMQDSSDFVFAKRGDSFRSHFGLIGNETSRGFKLHSALAFDASSFQCLGLSYIERIYRSPNTQPPLPYNTPIEEKESMRWLRAGIQSKKIFAKVPMVTIIADRESDIYDEWYRIPDEQTHLLTRCCHDRSLFGGGRLFADIGQSQLQGHCLVPLQAITKIRQPRTAKVEIRFKELNIKKADKCIDKKAPKYVALTVVEVKEVDVDPDVKKEEQLHWRLLTTHIVKNMADALQIIDWYKARWNIEQFFRTLKSQGFQVEGSLIENENVLGKLADMACIAATAVMQLVAARDGSANNVPCTIIFKPEEVELLQALEKTLRGKTEIQKNPHKNKSLSWASWVIARLGGWKSYSKSERPPGPITMKRGLDIFYQTKVGWCLRRDVGIR